MESNDFEKEVSRRLRELELSPEEEVWSRIEKKLGPGRKMREGVLLLMLFALFSSGTLWWLGHRRPVSGTVTESSRFAGETGGKRPVLKANKPGDNGSSGFEKPVPPMKKRGSLLPENDLSAQIRRNGPLVVPSSVSRFVAKQPLHARASLQKEFLSTFGAQADYIAELPEAKNSGIVYVNALRAGDTGKLAAFSRPVRLGKRPARDKQKWEPGITLSAGTAWINNFNSDASVPASFLATSPGQYYLNYPAYTGNNAWRPAPVKPSFSIAAGLFLEKRLSVHTGFSWGLSFHWMAVQNNLQNNFGYLEIPAQFHIGLGRITHPTVTIDAGVSCSRLVYADARQYDYNTGRWRKDNSIFKPLQANAQAGVSMRMPAGPNGQIRLGPSFSYGIIPVATSGIYEGKHWHTLNLDARWIFGKK